MVHLYIQIPVLFHSLFHFALSQDSEQSSLCYTVGLVFYLFLYSNPNKNKTELDHTKDLRAMIVYSSLSVWCWSDPPPSTGQGL